MIYITRRFTFAASHRIFDPKLSDEENLNIFGKCSNPSGHGHNYKLEVTICGEVDKQTGYLMDLTKLKEIVNKLLIDKVDHKNLNVDVDFMKDVNPTAENITLKFWEILKEKIDGLNQNIFLFSVRLTETENNIVEYKGYA